jgi:hypothetical protein
MSSGGIRVWCEKPIVTQLHWIAEESPDEDRLPGGTRNQVQRIGAADLTPQPTVAHSLKVESQWASGPTRRISQHFRGITIARRPS